ncbi:MAG: DUF1844 domain-containing protein [Planctomycetaceae bacterium]
MSTDAPEPRILTDEDWKERVRRENAEFDTRDSATAGAPPVDFKVLIDMLSMQALLALGLLAPAEGRAPEVQLPLARHMIDMLGLLEQKTAGNLTPDEDSLLKGTLHYLRMSYVEIAKRSAAAKG